MATYSSISQKRLTQLASALDGTTLPDVFPVNEWLFHESTNEAYTLFASKGNVPLVATPLIETSQSVVFALSQNDVVIGYSVSYDTESEFVSVDSKGFFLRKEKAKGPKEMLKWRSPDANGLVDKDYFACQLSVFGNATLVGHVIPDRSFNLTTLKSGVY